MRDVHALDTVRPLRQIQSLLNESEYIHALPSHAGASARFLSGVGLGYVHEAVVRLILGSHNTHGSAAAFGKRLFQRLMGFTGGSVSFLFGFLVARKPGQQDTRRRKSHIIELSQKTPQNF